MQLLLHRRKEAVEVDMQKAETVGLFCLSHRHNYIRHLFAFPEKNRH
jgi:hypothetical protein